MDNILKETLGTDRVIIECSNFDETVIATKLLHEMGFKTTQNSIKIAAGNETHMKWRHPYVDDEGVVHYYSSSYEWDDIYPDYLTKMMFQEFFNLVNGNTEDDEHLKDIDLNIEEFLKSDM